MYCKKCGMALPSHGFICKSCGTMMDSEQISKQKAYLKNEKTDVNLRSSEYLDQSMQRDYRKKGENKFLGAILIILVIVFLVIIALLKVM